jgi:hypothetical protein
MIYQPPAYINILYVPARKHPRAHTHAYI